MKTIWLVRHAKSDWGEATAVDFERHLNQRGYSDANKMSALLKSRNEVPETIISSPAIRAITTAIIFSRNFWGNVQLLKIEDKIYESSEDELMKIIERTYPVLNQVMFIGHNPTITACINSLASASIANVPTTGIAKITFDVVDWKLIAKGTGTLVYFDFPKNPR
jgi:phosphohistidine phosphatase